jgi:hypothetical protein
MEFYPVFDETDLVNLPNFYIYLKLMIDGVTSKAFSAITLPPSDSSQSFKSEVITASRERYGRLCLKIEKEMAFREKKYSQTCSVNRPSGEKQQFLF